MATEVQTSKVKEQLAKKASSPEKKGVTVLELIKKQEPAIAKALPKQISVERFSRIAMTAVRQNPKLQECNPISFLAALMQSAQLGLEPNTPLGQAYIIPYGKEAVFQIGYQGLLELAYRTGLYRSIYAVAVYQNDEFEYEEGLERKLSHKPSLSPEGDPVYYYAVYHLINGGYGFAVMSRDQIIAHRNKYSAAVKQGRSSPWETDFDSMAKKTVLKQALKYAPKSVEFGLALAADETVKTQIDENMLEVEPEDIVIEVIDDEDHLS